MGSWGAIAAAGRLVWPVLKSRAWCDRCRLDAYLRMLRTEALRERQESDRNVQKALERAGIPELQFWMALAEKTGQVISDAGAGRGYRTVAEARMQVFGWEMLGYIWNSRFDRLQDQEMDAYRAELVRRPWILDVFSAVRKENLGFLFFPYGGTDYLAALGAAAVRVNAMVGAAGEDREGLERAVYEAIRASAEPPGRGNPGVGWEQEKDDIGIFWTMSTLLALGEVARRPVRDSEIPDLTVPVATVEDLALGAAESIARHDFRFTDNSLARQFGPSTERVVLESAERIAREVRSTKKPSLVRIALEELRRYRADKETLTEGEWEALKKRVIRRHK